MNQTSNSKLYAEDRTTTLIFWVFISLHVLAWTALPFVVRYTLPLDSMEGYVWGQQLEWGYDKNPFMNGWLTALAVKMGGYSGWMIYLFSQLSVALCFWAVWRLGKKFLPPVYALLGVLLLEAVQYYNFHAIDFNDNTLELSLWALLILCFYNALRLDHEAKNHGCDLSLMSQEPSLRAHAFCGCGNPQLSPGSPRLSTSQPRDDDRESPTSKRGLARNHRLLSWLGCGLFAGLAMMTKYYTVVLLVPMTVFLFLFRENYSCFKSAGFYLALGLFGLIIAPHVVWLFSHDFVTISYAFDRVSSPPTWWNHLSYPWQFFYEQVEACSPAILLALILLIGKKPLALPQRLVLSRFDETFLIVVGLGPFFFTLLLSLLAGFKLRAGWGEPLFSLGGLLLLAYLQPRVTRARLYAFIGLLGALFLLALGGYSFAFIQGKESSSANFPGTALAKMLTESWHQSYHQPLPYVAGSRWLSGNIAFYSPDHPQVYINWNKRVSPWISEAELQQKGAIFIWEKDEIIPQDLEKRFPRLSQAKILRFNWLRNESLPPIEIKVAYLAPENSV